MTGRDHGGGLDAAAALWGSSRSDWIDLSTGINPVAYPLIPLAPAAWTALPDKRGMDRLVEAARRFWRVPDRAGVLAAPGASSIIARIPALASPGRVHIPAPTYNEHGAAFSAHGWEVLGQKHVRDADAKVLVHPNNPDGHFWDRSDMQGTRLVIVDEAFADAAPACSLIAEAACPGRIILKSFGKFWGLAGLRLGFAIGDPDLIAALRELLGPWPVSGPALELGSAALNDTDWAQATRQRLEQDAARLDAMVTRAGAHQLGGTALFRLYDTADAAAWQNRLARKRIWSRIFPYNPRWVRLGLPGRACDWARVAAALAVSD